MCLSPRKSDIDALLPQPFVRKIIIRLPEDLRPARDHYGFALELDMDGKVIYNLQDPAAANYAQIFRVQEHEGMPYLGSLVEDTIG